ncbi:MFS transporter [Salinicola sp.]|uniref:MFS transporter n=1 Tax=Salinicola sp. TaxID=1978524 RepID=UPI0025EC693C|nr:MFS transporter [Salinicola sp.]
MLAAALFAQTTAAVATQGIGVLGGLMQADMALTGAQLGLLAGALNAVPIVGLVVAGRWLDFSGEGRVVASGATLMALGMMLAAHATTLAGLAGWLLLVGTGYSTVQPGGSRAILRWFPPRERGLAMGLRQAGLPLGGVLAAALFPAFAQIYGWRMAWVLGAVLTLLGASAFCLVQGVGRQRPLSAPQARARAPAEALRPRVLLHLPRLRLALAAGAVLVGLQTIALTFLVLYLQQRYWLSVASGAVYLLAMQLSGALGRVLLALLSDRWRGGRRFVVGLAVVGALLGWIALGVYPRAWPPAGLWFVTIWLGFFGFGWYGPWVTWIAELAPAGREGSLLGVTMASNQIAIVAAPCVFGVLVDSYGYLVPGTAVAALLLVYVVWEAGAVARQDA